MKRATLLTLATLCAAFLAPASAGAAFGLKDLDLTFTNSEGKVITQAGAHPFAVTVSPATVTKEEPELPEFGEVTDEAVKDLVVHNFAGLGGNPTATPR